MRTTAKTIAIATLAAILCSPAQAAIPSSFINGEAIGQAVVNALNASANGVETAPPIGFSKTSWNSLLTAARESGIAKFIAEGGSVTYRLFSPVAVAPLENGAIKLSFTVKQAGQRKGSPTPEGEFIADVLLTATSGNNLGISQVIVH
jgi:hypothetical protein